MMLSMLSRLYESSLKLFERRVYLYGFYLGTRNETIPDFNVREIQCVLEYKYVVVDFLLFVGILDRGLYEVVQLCLRECGVTCLVLDVYVEHA